ncbi:uncharacterized protein NEMAJ01_0590 [Nematocida major]|uniref:uncharacterized protein n=1 Tax=Nematocida major TaxID=1912982 RepID=UPI002007388D|nr:uncharacterized protein NEMAJ01_0590 [Nematocida major]KAH9385694.1 hypothetical protein NEMAJ01_0590 [Nematocida major]
MDSVKVFLRVKGEGEKKEGEFSFLDNSVVDATGMYEFDKVFYGKDQQAVFQSISPIVGMALEGYNMAVFTYGQTGSGKTFTMEGTEEHPGIIPLTIEKVFLDRIESAEISMVEVYNEKIYDLISEKALSVMEGGSGVVLSGLTHVMCKTEGEAVQAFEQGMKARKTASNGVNSKSSRSHMVFVLKIQRVVDGCGIESKITLVDLAGSEKMCMEGEAEGFSVKRQKTSRKSMETSNINRSLLYLSRVISTLSTEGKKKHINYRDSKLTFILRDSLSQNCNLSIIGNVDPADQTETKSTISFLCTAKKIKLTPRTMIDEKTTEKLISRIQVLTKENMALKAEVKEMLAAKSPASECWAAKTVGACIKELQSLAGTVEALERRASTVEETVDAIKKGNNEVGALILQKVHARNIQEISALDGFPRREKALGSTAVKSQKKQ